MKLAVRLIKALGPGLIREKRKVQLPSGKTTWLYRWVRPELKPQSASSGQLDLLEQEPVGKPERITPENRVARRQYEGDPSLDPEYVARLAAGTKKEQAREAEYRKKWDDGHQERMAQERLAEWTTLDGQDVLRVPGSRFAAAPTTGKKNARRYVVFDVNEREEIAQVNKDEVYRWLRNAARNERDGIL